MSEKAGITIRLEGEIFELFIEIRKILKDVLGLTEEPSSELTMAMIFQYAKAPFRNIEEGFSEIRFVNEKENKEKVGKLTEMIRRDWGYFQLQRSESGTMH